MDLKEALKEALHFEEEGYELYKEAAETSFHPGVKKVFEFLAKEELNHVATLKNFIDSEGHTDELKSEGSSFDETEEFFNMTKEEFLHGIEFSEDETQALEKAVKLEESAHDYYIAHHENAETDELKKFFAFIVEQEKAHFQMLSRMVEFSKNPDAFKNDLEKFKFVKE